MKVKEIQTKILAKEHPHKLNLLQYCRRNTSGPAINQGDILTHSRRVRKTALTLICSEI